MRPSCFADTKRWPKDGLRVIYDGEESHRTNESEFTRKTLCEYRKVFRVLFPPLTCYKSLGATATTLITTVQVNELRSVTMNAIGVVGVILILSSAAESSLLDPVIENVRHFKATHPPDKVSGMWKKKMLWKPRWIKEWKSSNVLKPVWKKFWGPVIIREWVPIPKPPPQWDAAYVGPAEPPGAPSIDVGEPPSPNLSYIPEYSPSGSYVRPRGSNVQGGFAGGSQTAYKVPHLPVTTAFESQAETYFGQPSRGNNFDSIAYDLNPPVEQYNHHYSYPPPSGNRGANRAPISFPVTSSTSHSHGHRSHNRHYHHRLVSSGQTHPGNGPDLTKFPPVWNSWKSVPSKPYPHSSGLAQASSAVSVVSKVQSTTIGPTEAVSDHLVSQVLLPAENEFIQQAALVSEYHYTEQAVPNPTPAPPARSPPLSTLPPGPNSSLGINRTEAQTLVSGHSAHVLPPEPTPVRSPGPPVPFMNSNLIAGPGSAPVRPLSSPLNPVLPVPNPATSHGLSFPQNLPPLPSLTQAPAPARPGHTGKFPSSDSSHGLLPVASERPASIHHHPPPPTSPNASASGSLRNTPPLRHANVRPSDPVRAHTPRDAQTHKKIPVRPRKPASLPYPTPNGSPPPPPPIHHQNLQPPKKNVAHKPESPTDREMQVNAQEIAKLPSDFKILPGASVEAFHFVEGFPSNQTLNKAVLIGNINQVGRGANEVEIAAAHPHRKEVPPYVAKLARAIVGEHLKKAEKVSSQTAAEGTAGESAVSERSAVTIVYPSTDLFVRKTLRAYLEDESSAEKSTKVFVVTPVPQKGEGTAEDAKGA